MDYYYFLFYALYWLYYNYKQKKKVGNIDACKTYAINTYFYSNTFPSNFGALGTEHVLKAMSKGI